MSQVAYTVGRFQPPTIGHRMLIEATIAAAGEGGKAYVFVSKTENAKDSPLPPDLKVRLLEKMFQREVAERKVEFINTDSCTPPCGGPGPAFGYLRTKLTTKPSKIIFVIGKERLANPNTNGYFGCEADLWVKEGEKIIPNKFIPVGESAVRDMSAPANDAANMSGTKARKYACEDNKTDFYTALGFTPSTTENDKVNEVEDAYKIIRTKLCPSRGGVKRGFSELDPMSDDAPPPKRRRVEEEEYQPIPGGPDGEPVGGRRRTRRKPKFVKSKRIRSSKGKRKSYS
jgi:hypothetical protein